MAFLQRRRPTIIVSVVTGAALVASCAGDNGSDGEGTTAQQGQPSSPPSGESGGEELTQDDASGLDQQGVSAGHPLAAEAGATMLDQGGNAVDAAIAAAFAVSVVEPYASGIGGGGSALIADRDGQTEAVDYREVVAQDGQIPASNTGIPGFVAGMAELHEQRGTLEWEELLAPAVEMAEGGVPVTETFVQRRDAGGAAATSGLAQFAPGGVPVQVGDEIVQDDLAATFRTLQDQGPESFYTGELAGLLSSEVDGIDEASLDAYSVQHNEPPQGKVGDYEIVSSAAALPGVALIRMMQNLDNGGISEVDPNSVEHIRRVSEEWAGAEQIAQTELGDTDFVDVDYDAILGNGNGNGNGNGSGSGNADGEEEPLAMGDAPASDSENMDKPGNTTHITVVDGDGTVVSMTNTLTEFWGSGQEVGGFFLNDQLSRFSTVTSPNNRPEPGRRSVTWSNPTMVLDGEGRPVLGLGTPGGANILSILGNTLSRWALQGQSLEDAVAAPRFRLDSASGSLLVEQALLDDPVADQLPELGWPTQTAAEGLFGSVNALEIDWEQGTVSGPTDYRLEAGVVVSDAE
ncbi:gamma-glutamyltransferase [Candidatus Corynebacterium faecigallinarum]|uniref:gamma-glutamyltransferase n=1 Tax=Candidatus Corynebacterium faecigallinarum TaxID=2838528 RepID=UPI003FD54327